MTSPNRPTNEPLINRLLTLGEKRGAAEQNTGIQDVGNDIVALLQKLNIPQGILAEGIGQIRGKINRLSQEHDPAVREYCKETEKLLQDLLKELGEKTPAEAPAPQDAGDREQPPHTESTPNLELNKPYFLGDGNADRIRNDLNAFDTKEEGREHRWKALKAEGKDKVNSGTKAKISTGKEISWKEYLCTARDVLLEAKFPVRAGTRFASRTLAVLEEIAKRGIKEPADLEKPKKKTPKTKLPKPVPVIAPNPDDKGKEEERKEEPPEPPEPIPPISTPHPDRSSTPVTTRHGPLPVGKGKDAEHTPEKTPEAPSFSRYLHKILENPTSPEAINLLNKLKSDSGRLWIDKKKPDGTVVRIWLSLDLGLGNRALTDEELHTRILEKLGDMHNTLRFRVDDLSEGHSWKETKWTEQKKQRIAADVRKIKEALDAEPKGDADAAIQNIATALGLDEKAKEAFTFALFRSYCKKDGPKGDIWTAVRNAYWNADAWQTDIAAVNRELAERFGITTPLQSPSYNTAKIRVWEKIEKQEEKAAIQNAMNTKNPVTLHHAGKPSAKWTLESLKGGFYHLTSAAGKLWIREEHLRISLRQTPPLPAGEGLGEGTFELMAWQAQSEEPKGASAPPIAPPPKPKPGPTPAAPKPGPAAPVKTPPGPKAPVPPAAPVTATPIGPAPKGPSVIPASPKPTPIPAVKPAESKESAEARTHLIDRIRAFAEFSEHALHTGPGAAYEFLVCDTSFGDSAKHPGRKELVYKTDIQDLPRDYDAKKIQKTIEGEPKPSAEQLQVGIDEGWLYCHINGGYRKAQIEEQPPEKFGRFFLNIHPKSLAIIFPELIQELRNAKVHAQAKITEEFDTRYDSFAIEQLSRTDQCVIYYAEHEAEAVLQAIENVHRRNESAFRQATSLFVATVHDSTGKALKGVGFGEHSAGANTSFNSERALMLFGLADTYIRKRWRGETVDIEEQLRIHCSFPGLHSPIDPKNPAFNAGTIGERNGQGKKFFEGILHRLVPTPR